MESEPRTETVSQTWEQRWLFDIERRAILPIKWLLLVLSVFLLILRAPFGLPSESQFVCVLLFFMSNAFFSYIIYGKRFEIRYIHIVSYVSYAVDVIFIGTFVYLAASEGMPEQGIGGEFYVLFFLVLLRGSGFFPSKRMNLAVNISISAVFVITLVLLGMESFFSWESFLSKALILLSVMLLSWFLMEVSTSQKKRMLQVNEALVLQSEYNRRLLESIADGVIAVGPDMQVTAVNDAARQILGLEGLPDEPEFPVGADVLALPAEIAEAIRLTLEEGMRFTNQVIEVETKTGDSLTLRFSTGTIQTAGGRLFGIVAVFEDISVLRRLEDQMIRSEKLASVGELAAGLAHELGNPIGIIKSCAEYLVGKVRGGQAPESHVPEISEDLDVILSESERCHNLVQQLLSLSVRTEVKMGIVDICDLLERAVSLVRYQKEAEGIEFPIRCEPRDTRIRTDESLLTQALVNVLLNAVQSMKGKGTVSVDVMPADLADQDGASVRDAVSIRIRDEGCGMSPQVQKHIFDPFYTTKESGTGLGLSITHSMIERLSGTISVESEERKGSAFTITLPVGGPAPSVHGQRRSTGFRTSS